VRNIILAIKNVQDMKEYKTIKNVLISIKLRVRMKSSNRIFRIEMSCCTRLAFRQKTNDTFILHEE